MRKKGAQAGSGFRYMTDPYLKLPWGLDPHPVFLEEGLYMGLILSQGSNTDPIATKIL